MLLTLKIIAPSCPLLRRSQRPAPPVNLSHVHSLMKMFYWFVISFVSHLVPSCICRPVDLFETLGGSSSKERPTNESISGTEGFDLQTLDWRKANEIGIYNHSMSKHGPSPTCGKLLGHCKDKVASFRQNMGVRICIFKLGVTTNPISRFELYKEKGYSKMWLLATCSSVDLLHMLEAALISEHYQHVGCKNSKGSGGEGALNRTPPAPPPYFLYIVGGKADQGRWVG